MIKISQDLALAQKPANHGVSAHPRPDQLYRNLLAELGIIANSLVHCAHSASPYLADDPVSANPAANHIIRVHSVQADCRDLTAPGLDKSPGPVVRCKQRLHLYPEGFVPVRRL